MKTFKHMLVPTDFSEASDRALTTALDLARAFEARVTLLHVWSLPSLGYAEALSWPIEDLRNAAKAALAECYTRTSKLHPQLDSLLLGSVAEKVVRMCPVPVLTVGLPRG